MKLIEINEAEAIIEPFFDGGTSDIEETEPRYCVFDEYKTETLSGAVAAGQQAWAYVSIRVDKTVLEKPVLRMSRSCDLDVSDYDTFIVFASWPKDFRVSAEAVIDGKNVPLLDKVRGTGVSNEYTAPFQGSHLQALTFTFYCDKDGAAGDMSWLGLAHSGRLEQMLARKQQYPHNWPGCFADPVPCEPVPEIGILMDGEDLKELREKLAQQPFRSLYEAKKQKAEEQMSICPEDYIGRLVPHYDQRFSRSRDIAHQLVPAENAGGISEVIENLAFVGIVENNLEMMRMAVRHALSIAHCEYWCESPMGILPGATWHHRSFTENHYCKVVALVLDWCGQLMTPFAKQILRDALAMKGLPRIESDFRRMEYIRSMNQGIVFSYGRIFAQLALLPKHPRYAKDLVLSEQDLKEMIGNYVNQDGGTPEGPGYWMFTFNEVLPAFYALARYHKQPFTYYKDLFAKTGDFELSMLSCEDNSTVMFAVNDAHPRNHIRCALAASLYQFTGKAAWKNLYERLIQGGYMDGDTFALISAPLPDGTQLPEEPLNRLFPFTGQLGSVRQGEDLQTHLHLCSGATCSSHFHEDKGSIILEAGGEPLCPDCGCGYYYESELQYLQFASSHNLLCPIFADDVPARQGRYDEGGKIITVRQEGESIEFVSDDTAAWSGSPYKKVQRRVVSPFAELILLQDSFQLDKAQNVEFLLGCKGEWMIENKQAHAKVGDVTLRLLPLNWSLENAAVRRMEDGEHRPVWQLRAPVAQEKEGQLLTLLCIEKNLKFELDTIENGWTVRHGARVLRLENSQTPFFTQI